MIQVFNKCALLAVYIVTVLACCCGQREPALPLSPVSFHQLLRTKMPAPAGRSTSLKDIYIRHYSANTTSPKSYRIRDIKRILADPSFDRQRPTVLYAHGFVELSSDDSVVTVVQAYVQHGGYNVLLLDWSNAAFGSYINACLNVQPTGAEVARALLKLLREGLSLERLHLVGHSLGSHVLATSARLLALRGYTVPRLSCLDPAYPGYYPPLLGPGVSSSDAAFVDAVHTDGGGYGAPDRVGHADFWPNEGRAKQPGCLSATIPFTVEDFCSHWRSWAFWAESVRGGQFLARPCADYDSFLRGACGGERLVHMGLHATPESVIDKYYKCYGYI